MSDKPISEKIKDLQSIGLHVEVVGDKYRLFHEKKNANNPYWVTFLGYGVEENPNLHTPREVAKIWKNHFGKGSKEKELVKAIGKGKDRARTRDLIKREDFDNIPLNDRVKKDDPWNYD
jgi:hypothetical protein